MAISIFEVDAPAESKVTYDVVGRFRAGHQINKRPQSLEEWRVTSDDKELLETVSGLLGGSVQTWDNDKTPFEVFTDQKSVSVTVERIFSGMTLWGRAGAIHRCDGETISYPEEMKGQPCNMAGKSIEERKAGATNGTSCSPDITIRFRLTGQENLGLFEFKTGSWGMARDIAKVESDLEKLGGKAEGTLTLEPVEFVQKSTGQNRRFIKSSVTLTKAAE